MKVETKEVCRVCGVPIYDRLALGSEIALPRFERAGVAVETAPLVLAECLGCGLIQLRHTVEPDSLFRSYYYESSLNESMREHLRGIVRDLLWKAPISPGDTVVDIGCNDGTLLSTYGRHVRKVGFDPNGYAAEAYGNDVDVLIGDYFSPDLYSGPTAKIVTSIAMLYDLDDPIAFVKGIAAILAADGIWVSEQHYAPKMLAANEVDVVCHEHLTYLRLDDVCRLAEAAGLEVYDVEFNEVNGGSFRTYASPLGVRFPTERLGRARLDEAVARSNQPTAVADFGLRACRLLEDLSEDVRRLSLAGNRVLGLGASTKGSTLLQAARIGPDTLPAVSDRNPRKFNAVMPGVGIPIVSEETARLMEPDVFLVLPYHFAPQLRQRERDFLNRGGRFLLPCPSPHLLPGPIPRV